MTSADNSMRKVLEAKGITPSFAREAHANYAERVNECKQRLQSAEKEAAWWLKVAELLSE